MAIALQLLTASDFRSHVGKEFQIQFSGQNTGIAYLEKVIDLPAYESLERKPFSILLQTVQNNRQYQQGIYKIEHPALGTMDIFLVPVAINEKGLQYEAVFS
ncbi:MAG: hypothetical protein V4717_12200 [Bacteroidota bacterium]